MRVQTELSPLELSYDHKILLVIHERFLGRLSSLLLFVLIFKSTKSGYIAEICTQQLKFKIISVSDTMWKLEVRILTLRKKINFLVLNTIYFWFLVLVLHAAFCLRW